MLAAVEAASTGRGLIERGRFRAALGEAMRLASEVNQYVSDQAPWALVKTDRDRARRACSTSRCAQSTA